MSTLRASSTPSIDETSSPGKADVHTALVCGSVGTWRWDVQSDVVMCSEMGHTLLGLERVTDFNYQRFLAAVHSDDRERVDQELKGALSESGECDVDFRVGASSGTERWLRARGRARHDQVRRPLLLEGVLIDVTRYRRVGEEERGAEDASADPRAQLMLAIEHCPALIALFDRDMRYLAASHRWITGFRVEGRPIIGRSHYDVFPEISQRWKDIHRRCLAGEMDQSDEDTFQRLDGSMDWLRWEIHPWRKASGEVGGIAVFAELITEQKKREEALRASEERLRLAITGAALGTWHWNMLTGELVWSELAFALFGMKVDPAMTFEKFMAAVHPDDRERVQQSIQRSVEGHTDHQVELRACWPDGTVHWLATKGRPFFGSDGSPVRMEGIAFDITTRKQAEQALREGERRFRELAEAVPHLVWQLAPDGSVIYANRRWADYFGRSGLELFEWQDVLHPEDLPRMTQAFTNMTRMECNFEPFRMRRHDGTYHWFECRSVPVWDADGKLLHIVGTSTDVEQVKETEAALYVSRRRLDTALRAAGMGTWVWEIDQDRLLIDEALAQLFGAKPGDPRETTMEAMLERVHGDDQAAVRQGLTRACEHRGDFEVECRVRRFDEKTLWVTSKGRVEDDKQGHARRLFGACVDLTQHKRLEEELRQAQKMEAIGRLAGGVAHDFNNLLTVILGQSSMLTMRKDLPRPVDNAVRDIVSSAERAASLTAQLLAFGRRQPMRAQTLDLNTVVESVSQMLQRLLGENVALSSSPTLHSAFARIPTCWARSCSTSPSTRETPCRTEDDSPFARSESAWTKPRPRVTPRRSPACGLV
jgi:PAS domain S-box-containing protein